MENLDCRAIFSNPYWDGISKTEYSVNPTFSQEFYALFPQKLVIRTQLMANKHLTFLVNALFTQKHSFRVFPVTNFTITRLVKLVAFLPSGSLWQPSMSKRLTSVPESFHIPITVSSRIWLEDSFEMADISTSLRLLYCYDLDCSFWRFTILFWRFWLTFLPINNVIN